MDWLNKDYRSRNRRMIQLLRPGQILLTIRRVCSICTMRPYSRAIKSQYWRAKRTPACSFWSRYFSSRYSRNTSPISVWKFKGWINWRIVWNIAAIRCLVVGSMNRKWHPWQPLKLANTSKHALRRRSTVSLATVRTSEKCKTGLLMVSIIPQKSLG